MIATYVGEFHFIKFERHNQFLLKPDKNTDNFFLENLRTYLYASRTDMAKKFRKKVVEKVK
jgi:hypothetical protein